jgi:hypothetical protein
MYCTVLYFYEISVNWGLFGVFSEVLLRHAYISTLKKLGFEGEKGQLREWMTVARDRSAWGRKVEYKLCTPSPGLFHESPQTLNEARTIFDKLA